VLHHTDGHMRRTKVLENEVVKVRIPRHRGHDSMLMADSVPARWRTPFHAEGGQHSKLMVDT